MILRSVAAVVLALTVALATVTAAPTGATARPNIIVIVSDDCGYNEFSMHGSTLFSTPRIDSIATNGVRFSQGYVSGSVCSPTRAGLLTGRYQQRFGHEYNIPPVYSEENGLPTNETTLADTLKSAGYRTIALGKWHLGYAPKFHPLARGFDDYYGFLQGARPYSPIARPTRLNQLLRDREPVQPETFDYLTDELGRAAADYIVKHRAQPFFMYLAFNATHDPTDALASDLAKVEDTDPVRRKHRAMTLALDRAVGVVLDELKRQALTENTLVVFINDNGGATTHDNAPLRGKKGSMWDGGIRVAYAMQWPAVLPKGKTYASPAISLDIFPTALAAAGVARTTGPALDGVNLLPLLTGTPPAAKPRTLFWKMADSWAVRDGDLKLVNATSATTTPALFDLAQDPAETTDLTASRAADVQRLQALYLDWKRDVKPTLWGRDAGSDSDSTADQPRPKGAKQKSNPKK